jgi:sugar phosphate permease
MSDAADRLAPARWGRLIPVVFITYSFAYVDRANFSFGAAGGMAHDLGISGGLSSLLGALFFLGYFLFQVPGAHYAENHSAKRLVFWSLILWGALASATGLISNVTLLFIDRFLLGIVESAVLPAMIIFLSHWFTRKERSLADTFLILGNPITVLWMSIVSGYLVQSLGWRGMFIVEGLPAVLWAFVWWRLVDDHPRDAQWLPPADRTAVERALDAEQAGLRPVRNYMEAFRSRAVILLTLQYLFWSIGIYGFILWLPSMLKSGSSIGIVGIGWLSAVPYVLAAVLMLAASFASDRLEVRKPLIWPFLLLGALALYGSYAIGPGHYWWSYALLVVAGGAMYAPYGPFFALIPEILPRNVAGGATGLINSFGALGSFLGTYLVGFLNASTGSDSLSFLFMAACLVISTVLTMMVPVEHHAGQGSMKAASSAEGGASAV